MRLRWSSCGFLQGNKKQSKESSVMNAKQHVGNWKVEFNSRVQLLSPGVFSGVIATVVLLLLRGTGDQCLAQPIVDGATTTRYATVPYAQACDFSDSGILYVAPRESIGSSPDVKVRQVSAGGSLVESFGDQSIQDIDSVLVDRKGTFTGTPGTLLLGSGTLANGAAGTAGIIYQITPDGETSIWMQDRIFGNAEAPTFDRNGRLVVFSYGETTISVVDKNRTIQATINIPNGVYSVAVDSLNRLVVGGRNQPYLALYDMAGQLLNAQFAYIGSGAEPTLATAKGGYWGTDVYAGTNGRLLRIGTDGTVATVGSGRFGNEVFYGYFAFGPDGALYVCDLVDSAVWKVKPPLAISSIYVSAVDICWNTLLNVSYQLQYRSDLTNSQWVNLGSPILGTGETMCVKDNIAPGQPTRFYQVKELP